MSNVQRYARRVGNELTAEIAARHRRASAANVELQALQHRFAVVIRGRQHGYWNADQFLRKVS